MNKKEIDKIVEEAVDGLDLEDLKGIPPECAEHLFTEDEVKRMMHEEIKAHFEKSTPDKEDQAKRDAGFSEEFIKSRQKYEASLDKLNEMLKRHIREEKEEAAERAAIAAERSRPRRSKRDFVFGPITDGLIGLSVAKWLFKK